MQDVEPCDEKLEKKVPPISCDKLKRGKRLGLVGARLGFQR